MSEPNTSFLQRQLAAVGEQATFMGSFFRNVFRKRFEWDEFIHQCYLIGYRSFPLILITGFILGFVLTLQSMPTLRSFGAQTFIPSMVSISVVREIGPVIIALICAGKVSSSIGAELGSMKVSEQIDAMLVSGSNPMQYLVVTRILACTFMIPLLTLVSDGLSLVGGFVANNLSGHVSPVLYFNKATNALMYTDLFPALIKTIFFGFTIGFVGCYKGYHATRGTESVGLAANTAVVSASLWVIVLDAVAAQLTTVFAYN